MTLSSKPRALSFPASRPKPTSTSMAVPSANLPLKTGSKEQQKPPVGSGLKIRVIVEISVPAESVLKEGDLQGAVLTTLQDYPWAFERLLNYQPHSLPLVRRFSIFRERTPS